MFELVFILCIFRQLRHFNSFLNDSLPTSMTNTLTVDELFNLLLFSMSFNVSDFKYYHSLAYVTVVVSGWGSSNFSRSFRSGETLVFTDSVTTFIFLPVRHKRMEIFHTTSGKIIVLFKLLNTVYLDSGSYVKVRKWVSNTRDLVY